LSQDSIELPVRLLPLELARPSLVPWLLAIGLLGAIGLAALNSYGFTEATVMPLAITCVVGGVLLLDTWLRSHSGARRLHIELTPNTFEERAGHTSRRFRWLEIKPFAVTAIYSEGGHQYFVTTSTIASEQQESVMIDPAVFLEDDPQRSAERLVRWIALCDAACWTSGGIER
jgi:hypothetical protein